MDIILILLYLICFVKTWKGSALLALFLFAISINIVSYDYSYMTDNNYDYIIFAVIYSSLCLLKDKYIKVCSLVMVIFYYIMAWDYYLNPTVETTLYQVYPFVTFMLNLALMLTITRGVKDGFYNADNCWYNDSKLN